MPGRFEFDPQATTLTLSRLDRLHAVAYAAACCERLLPNYRFFSDKVGWGDFGTLRLALDTIWALVEGHPIPSSHLRELVNLCDTTVPDTEDFGTLWASHALDASSAVCETLELCLDGNLDHVTNVMTSARDTVDMFIQERDDMDYDDPAFEESISNDELMIRELRNQHDDLRVLSSERKVTTEVAQFLRSKYCGRSNVM